MKMFSFFIQIFGKDVERRITVIFIIYSDRLLFEYVDLLNFLEDVPLNSKMF